jgi:Putative transposase
MTLSPDEFIRRFLLHVLPKGFHRIRHYGLLASAGRKVNVTRARVLLVAPAPAEVKETASPPDQRPPCPCCGGRMVVIEIFQRAAQARAPPSSPSFTGMSVS